jgi:CO/xanthine dehydrogenase FAD-binding subunit
MRPFAYERPASLAEAFDVLAEHGDGQARVLAGGTDLLIRLRDGTFRPHVVVDVKRIAEIDDGIREDDGRLVIGARAAMTEIMADARVLASFPALADAASYVGSVQIRNRATLAGNLCNASPAADTAPALLVYDAVVVAAGPGRLRRIPVDEWFVRSGVTTLAPDEIVTAIELPLPDGPRGSAFERRTRRRGHDLASVTLACSIDDDGVTRVAYGSVGPRPVVAVDHGGALADPTADPDARRIALDTIFADASPSRTSMRAGPDYRLAMLRVLGIRAADEAAARLKAAGGRMS